MKKLLLILLSVTAIYAQSVYDPASQSADPLIFDNNTTEVNANGYIEHNDNNSSLIGDDTLPKTNIDMGEQTLYNVGEKTIYVKKDESGNRIFLDSNGTVYDMNSTSEANQNMFKEIQKQYNEFLDTNDTNDTNVTVNDLVLQNAKTYELKEKQINAASKKAGSIQDLKTRLTSGISIVGSGESTMSIFDADINHLEAKRANGEELTDQEINELNATVFYRNNNKLIPKYDKKKNLMQENTTALSNAYQGLETVQSELTARLRSSEIKCQITRNLIPSYFCPITGKDGLRFPANSTDALKVNMNDVYDRCNKFCVSDKGDYPVVNEKILPSDDLNITIDPIKLLPDYNKDTAKHVLETNGIMPLKFLKLYFSLPNSKDNNLTDEEWQSELDTVKPRVKISLYYYTWIDPKDHDKGETVNILYKDMTLRLYSPELEYNLPITVIAHRYKLTVNKPFFQKNNDDKVFLNDNGTISLVKLESKYTSDSFWYCSITQTVTQRDECFNPFVNAKEIKSSGQDIFICRDRKHKVGPEIEWGGFFTKEEAETECIIAKECVPTYGSAAGEDLNVVYDTTINCVDDPTNTNCNDKLCQELFKDQNKTILNEYFVELSTKDKIENRYTIKNGALTGDLRPKINFDELSNVDNYTDLFKTEEKDAAYISMVKNISFNRDNFRVGTESPAQTMYTITGSDYTRGIKATLKPGSFDYSDTDKYYVYSVMIMDHSFEPLYGSWYIKGNNIIVTNGKIKTSNILVAYNNNNGTLSTTDINTAIGANLVYNEVTGKWEMPDVRFMDRTYLIKTGDQDNEWKTFRRIKNYKYQNMHSEYYLDDNGDPHIRTIKEWVDIPAYTIDKFEFYNEADGTFSSYDPETEKADYFTESIFNKNQDFFDYLLTSNTSYTYVSPKGGLIHDQVGINNNTSFKRLYNVDYSKKLHDSLIRNSTFFLLYSDHKLTYNEIEEEIEGSDWRENPINAFDNKWGVYETIGAMKFRNRIHGDEELNNGIILIKKGTPESLTLGIKWRPKDEEKGSKAYKFVFLYDDNELGGK